MNANLNIIEALGQIAREKNVDREMVIETLSEALISAAKKRYGNADNFEVQIDADSGRMSVLARKTVVEQVNEPEIEIDPMITHTMGLEDINKAFDLMHEGESIRSVIHF